MSDSRVSCKVYTYWTLTEIIPGSFAKILPAFEFQFVMYYMDMYNLRCLLRNGYVVTILPLLYSCLPHR